MVRISTTRSTQPPRAGSAPEDLPAGAALRDVAVLGVEAERARHVHCLPDGAFAETRADHCVTVAEAGSVRVELREPPA